MYTALLLRNGFDDIETLADLEEADIKDLGIPQVHANILRRKVAELNGATAGEGMDANPVVVFLREIGLEQYAQPLLAHGFDEMETLLDVEDEDLRDMGVPRGHVVKLKKRLRQYELAAEEYQYAEPLAPAAARRAPCPPPAAATRGAAASSGQWRGVEASSRSHVFSARELSCLEQSWEEVQARGVVAVGGLLYRHLFAIAPQSKCVFPPEVRERYREWLVGEDPENLMESHGLKNLFSKVVNAVGCTVTGLRDLGKLVPMLTKLGARHISYNVQEGYWDILGKALDVTLQDILGEAYTMEVRRDWQLVYSFMSAVMLEGFRKAKRGDASSPSSAGGAPSSSSKARSHHAGEAPPRGAGAAPAAAASGIPESDGASARS